NQGAGGIGQGGFQNLLNIAFGTSAGATIVGFTADGNQPYNPSDQGTLPPWFANSPQAAAINRMLNDFVFRCGTFLATDTVGGAPWGSHACCGRGADRRGGGPAALGGRSRRSEHRERVPQLRAPIRVQHVLCHERQCDPARQCSPRSTDRAPLDRLCPLARSW